MKKIKSSLLLSGTTLAVSVMVANVVNLLFNAYLGRIVSTENFGVLGLINTFMYFGSLIYNAIGGITNREVAFLDHSVTSEAGTLFFLSLSKQLLIINGILALIWVLIVPWISDFFHVSNLSIFYLFTPLFILYPLSFLGRGFLQGKLLFVLAGISIVAEPFFKFTSALLLLSFNQQQLLYLSIYISGFLTGAITFILAWKRKSIITQKINSPFPLAFFGAALLSGISTLSFLAIDLILVKHFMNPQEAGYYAFLSLVGKIVFFAGSLLNIFTISLVSRESQHRKNPVISLYLLLSGSAILTAGAIVILGVFSNITIPLLFAGKADAIIPYVLPYLCAIALFTLGNTIVTYHLALKQFLFPVISVVISLFLIAGIYIYHTTITQIIYTLLWMSLVNSVALTIAHIKQSFFSPPVALSPLEKISEEVI